MNIATALEDVCHQFTQALYKTSTSKIPVAHQFYTRKSQLNAGSLETFGRISSVSSLLDRSTVVQCNSAVQRGATRCNAVQSGATR